MKITDPNHSIVIGCHPARGWYTLVIDHGAPPTTHDEQFYPSYHELIKAVLFGINEIQELKEKR